MKIHGSFTGNTIILTESARQFHSMPKAKTKPSPPARTKPEPKGPDAPRGKTPALKQWDLARTYLEAVPVAFFDDALDPDNAADDREATITEEFAADIARKGVQQPVWFRMVGTKPRLIAGERRILAARKAPLITVPAFDYGKLTDDIAAQLAELENCQRENLTVPQQAKAYARLVTKCGWKWWHEKNPAKSIGHAFSFGKSAAYEWQALANLGPLAEQALNAKQLEKSVAIRLSRIFRTEDRTEATARAIRDRWTDQTASEIIAAQYMAVIPDDIERTDTTFPGAPACTGCPHNSGSQADFIKGRGDLCANLPCLTSKRGEAHRRKAALWLGPVWTEKQAIANGLRNDEFSGPACLSRDYCNLDSTAEFYNIPGYKPKKKTLRENLGDDLSEKDIILTRTNDGRNTELQIIPLIRAMKLLQKRGLITAPAEKRDTPQQKEAEQKRARATAIRNEVARLIVGAAEEMAEQLKLKNSDPLLDLHRITTAAFAESIGSFNFRETAARRLAEKTDLRYTAAQGLIRLLADRATKPPELLGIIAEIHTLPDAFRDNVTTDDWSEEAVEFIHWLELDLQTLIATATATVDANGESSNPARTEKD